MANITPLDTITGQGYVATPNNPIPQGTGMTPSTPVPVKPVTGGQVNYTPPQVTQVKDAAQSGQVVQGYLNNLLSLDSSYMRNATAQGLAVAGSRGLLNSSLAAGAAQAANINAAMPILSETMNLNNQREQQAYQGEQNQFDRNLSAEQLAAQQKFQGIENNADRSLQSQLENARINAQQAMQQSQFMFQSEQASLDRTQRINEMMLNAELGEKGAKLQYELEGLKAQQDYNFKSWLQDDAVKQQDWLNSQNYIREFNGTIAANNVKTATDMWNTLFKYAVDNPEVYTPSVITGMQDFFTNNYFGSMDKWFGKRGPELRAANGVG